jgi:YfiH family protein
MTDLPETLPLTPGYVRPAMFRGIPGLIALQTTRTGGVSLPPHASFNLGINTGDEPENVENNYLLLCRHLRIDRKNVVLSAQVHGTRVCHALHGGQVGGYDAIISRTPGLYMGILTADCFPVLVHDLKTSASAAIHAGWKGTAGHITLVALQAMQKEFGTRPEDCRASIGAGISAQHYEVGKKVADNFPSLYLHPSPSGGGRSMLDLARANRDQLLAFGIPASQLEQSGYCTWQNNDLFFSCRRESGKTGRMLSLIGITPAVASH